jgi:hypothetical protein
MEKGLCRGITAAEFKSHLQHKILIARLLQDPTVMETLAGGTYKSFIDAATDDDKAGGVPLLDDDKIIWEDEHELPKPLIPATPMVPPRMPVQQQMWPELNEANGGGVDLAKSMRKLAVSNKEEGFKPNTGKLNVEAWPLPADYKKGDPLPAPPSAWTAANAASKDLFLGAKPTPPPSNWEGMSAAITNSNNKTNLLHYHFMNPAHQDIERFYNPLIEKYKCPMPDCW